MANFLKDAITLPRGGAAVPRVIRILHPDYSAAENTLENQRLGPLQLRVAALCTLVQVCDGYDINAIGVAVPSLTHAWGLPGPAFTTAFLWSSIGILVGALASGPIGDRAFPVHEKPLELQHPNVAFFNVSFNHVPPKPN